MPASLLKLKRAELLLALAFCAASGVPALAAAADLSTAFAAVARVVGPAVVNISTTTVVPGRTDPFARMLRLAITAGISDGRRR